MKNKKTGMTEKNPASLFGYDLIDEKDYFHKLENGKNVYFPWGKGGEAYYVSDREHNLLKLSQGLVLIFLALMMIIISISKILGYEGFVVLLNIAIASNILFIFAICRKSVPYKLNTDTPERMKRQSRFTIDCLVTMLAQSVFFVLGVINNPESLFVWGYGIFIFAYYPALLFYFKRRSGYIFQKMPTELT